MRQHPEFPKDKTVQLSRLLRPAFYWGHLILKLCFSFPFLHLEPNKKDPGRGACAHPCLASELFKGTCQAHLCCWAVYLLYCCNTDSTSLVKKQKAVLHLLSHSLTETAVRVTGSLPDLSLTCGADHGRGLYHPRRQPSSRDPGVCLPSHSCFLLVCGQ